ncbi:SseB family protein, partial [Micromonospora sp. CPCC 205711]|uniref:SseB family protein n=1 Tax=Micromonospora sp. CPCC 205547 TaxID=3122400 RepID=UPI002FF1C939
MTDWEPATEAETAMRDALQANDQELYFRILAQTELFLPVSAQALAGEAPMGWGTWTTGGRTHVLAFTSTAAVHACLGATAGPSRRRAFADLATDWPHHEWWLAVNPGLPVEGYLPAWFVSQLSRGDVRLPGRTMGARARLERAETLARARGDAAPGQEPSSAPPPGVPTTGGWTPPRPAVPAGAPASGATAIGAVPEGRSDLAAVRIPGTSPASPGSGTDADDAGAVDGGARAGNGRVPAAPGGPTDLLRPSPLRRRSLGEETGPANGRSSFFEPAPGRGGAVRSPRDNPLRAGDRAAPSPRPGLGGQPFPRRRPATNLPDDDPTRAFQVDDDPTRAFRVDDQVTQPIPAPAPADRRPDPLAEEPTRAFRLDPPAAEATQVLPRRTLGPADEQTQRLPDPTVRPVPPAAPASFAEELPASIAEPVSGPPAPRRGFSPIVIEGTVIESRDLPGPHEPDPVTAAFGWRPTVGAPRVDDEAADVSAPSSPAPGSRPGTVDAELASIAFPAGAAFPTAPATTGPVDAAPSSTGPSSTTPSSTGPSSTGRFGAAPASNGPVDSGPATTEPVESRPATTEPVRAPFAGPTTVPRTPANGTPSDLDPAWLSSGGAPAAGVTPDDAGPEPTLRTTPSAGTGQAAPTAAQAAPTLAQAAPTAAQAAPTLAQAAPTAA